eukprot:scaffold10372_cov44-Attheya_sp.AAC.6
MHDMRVSSTVLGCPLLVRWVFFVDALQVLVLGLLADAQTDVEQNVVTTRSRVTMSSLSQATWYGQVLRVDYNCTSTLPGTHTH